MKTFKPLVYKFVCAKCQDKGVDSCYVCGRPGTAKTKKENNSA